MKSFPWLTLAAFEVLCLLSCGVTYLVESVYRDEFKDLGFPTWTQTVVASQAWMPLFPLPWLVYAVWLMRQREIQVSSLFTFAGTLCLCITLFLTWVIGGLLLPYFATHILLMAPAPVGP